jgi:nucleotide-binding universal stress UspA family protein
VPAPFFQRIAVATDGSPTATRAVDIATDLAHRYGAKLTIITVSPLEPMYVAPSEGWVTPTAPPSDLPFYRQVLERDVARAKASGVVSVEGVCLEGVVVDEIVAWIEKGPPDLFVIGSRGLSRGKRILLGSVSQAVLQQLKCPVLVVHPGASTSPSA